MIGGVAGLEIVEIRPRRDWSRYRVARLASKRYYAEGGFVVRDGTVTVARTAFYPEQSFDVSQVAAVVCAFTAVERGDWRVLLVGHDGQVLARRWAMFFTDDDLERLAAAIGCSYRRQGFTSLRALKRAYPGALRYRWHPRGS